MKGSILIVDGETDFLEWAKRQLENPKTTVYATSSSEKALRIYTDKRPDLVICETHVHPFSGIDLLVRIREIDANAIVILISAFGSTQVVIEAIKMGAFDFLRKETLPFNLKVVADEALKAKAELRSATASKPQLTVEQHKDSIVGQSPAMQQVFKMIGRVAHSDAPVMVTGESGTGKELVASAIHNFGNRAGQTFLAINCAAIPESLLESEIFGHEKGAFTGAVNQRIGRFEQCHGGTLFLDEIGDMPFAVQGKLLRVLQQGEFSRVGSNETLHADVRIIAATNKNLETEVTDKLFREDLFYRLNVVRIHLPPLRQRRADIKLLAEYFLQRIAKKKHVPLLKLSEEAIRYLEAQPWPGNVREFENTLERACVLSTTDVLLPKDIPLGSASDNPPSEQLSTGEASADIEAPLTTERAIEVLIDAAMKDSDVQLLPWLEREFTVYALKNTAGNQVQAAKLLGITRATLRKRIERYGIIRELTVSSHSDN